MILIIVLIVVVAVLVGLVRELSGAHCRSEPHPKFKKFVRTDFGGDEKRIVGHKGLTGYKGTSFKEYHGASGFSDPSGVSGVSGYKNLSSHGKITIE